jgi:ABC-type uncharacterized transport system permease subunit
MPSLNPSQKGFAVRLAIVAALTLVGFVLAALTKSGMPGMETNQDMNSFSLLNMVGVFLFIATPWIAIGTLRYGRRHETEIREHSGLSRLLTLYRILFWLQVAILLLAALFFGGLTVLFTHPVG